MLSVYVTQPPATQVVFPADNARELFEKSVYGSYRHVATEFEWLHEPHSGLLMARVSGGQLSDPVTITAKRCVFAEIPTTI